MLRTASVVAAVLAAAAPVAAQSGLSKPAIKPSFDLDGTMETQLRSTLPTHSFTVTTWAPGFVPQACKTEATSNSVNAADFAVLNVTYSDCADPWVVCRHKDSPVSQTDTLTYFGQIPVGMRQYVRNLIAMPTSSNVAYTVGAYTVVFGDWFHIGTMAHEFTHILDTVALTQYVTTPGSPFSNTARWQNQENKDTALPTGYAASSWQEDFAEAGRVALTDMIVSGGLAGINPNASQIAVQVSTYEQYLKGTVFTTTGRCTAKAPSTSPVPVSSSAKVNAALLGPVPDVSLSGEVPEIVIPEEANNWKFIHPLPATH